MYKLKEIAEILNVSDRTVERYLKSYFSMEKGAYIVSEKMLEILKSEYLEDDSDTVVEEFTKEDYIEFQKRLSEYPLLKERTESLLKDIEYHRKSIESHNRQMELILLSITNRKFIEE
jgi:predicted transcriptional regulator